MIEFVNIRTGKKKRVTTEPMLAAFYNSSDQGPNSHEGQDFGWRLAPSTLSRMRQIKADPQLMNTIAATFQLPLDGVRDTDVLTWISNEEARKQGSQGTETEDEHRRRYEDEVRALEDQGRRNAESAAKAKPRTVNRSSESGEFVSDEEVEESPETTVTETVSKPESQKPEKANSNSQAGSAKMKESKEPKQEN